MIEFTCQHCGKSFKPRRPSDVKRKALKYCSHQCYWDEHFGTPEERFWQNVQKTDGCWLWTGNGHPNGYGRFKINGHTVTVTHFSWKLHHGTPIPPGMLVCHTCDNPQCVRPDHLFLGTRSDNAQDASAKGRLARGRKPRKECVPRPYHHLRGHPERNPSVTHPESRPRAEKHYKAKLTWEQVREMRALYATGQYSFRALAKRYNMTSVGVSGICRHHTWK